jgi:hypothetical protein
MGQMGDAGDLHRLVRECATERSPGPAEVLAARSSQRSNAWRTTGAPR